MHTAPFQLHMVPDKLFPLAAPAVTAAAIHKLPFTSGRLQLQLPFDSLPTRLDMHLCTHVNGRTQ